MQGFGRGKSAKAKSHSMQVLALVCDETVLLTKAGLGEKRAKGMFAMTDHSYSLYPLDIFCFVRCGESYISSTYVVSYFLNSTDWSTPGNEVKAESLCTLSNLDYSFHFIECSYIPSVSSIPLTVLRPTAITEWWNGAIASTRYRLGSYAVGEDPYKNYPRHANTAVGEIDLGCRTDR